MEKPKPSLVIFTRYSRLGASSRLRTYQFLPQLQNEFIIKVFPLFDDEYLKRLYNGQSYSTCYVIKRYFQRFVQLLSIKQYDLVWIEKELFPFAPSWAEAYLNLINKPYVVDYDDAIFHNYDLSNNPVKKLLATKIDKVMHCASLVMVGNGYLADRAIKAGATHVERLPTVIDISRYAVSQDISNYRLVVGWIGSPSTIKYLEGIAPALKALALKFDFTLRVIGAEIEITGVSIVCIPWEEDTEVSEIQKFDVGIMPLTDSLWEKGKCGYKLIQYMACGIPVIASPVGVNSEIIKGAGSGFLASSDEEWQLQLERLFSNVSLRKQLGHKGRVAVENTYSVDVVVPKIIKLFKELTKKG